MVRLMGWRGCRRRLVCRLSPEGRGNRQETQNNPSRCALHQTCPFRGFAKKRLCKSQHSVHNFSTAYRTAEGILLAPVAMYFGLTHGLPKFRRGILPWTRKMQAEALRLINVISASASKTRNLPRLRRLWIPLVLLVVGGVSSFAQNCQTAGDMDASQRSAIENAAKRYFDMTSRGDSASLRQNSISAVAANFSGIETAVKDNQPSLSGAKATVRPPFLLTAEGSQPLARGEFLCGVFGATGQTRESAVFVLNNLPPGKYAVAIIDVTGGKVPPTLTLILQQ